MFRTPLPGLILATALAAAPATVGAQAFDLPDIPECTQLTPGAISAEFTPTTVSVRVVLDGVSQFEAGSTVAAAMTSYMPQDVTLDVSYDTASFASNDADELIGEVKSRYGGRRPAGTQLVYVLTSKDLTAAGLGSAVAGLADCIGGISRPENAFAVGESDPGIAAEVMAHELGHLMGAHHHYANCAESLPNGGSGPCTLMINDVGLAGLPFSTLNGTVVRGHAQLFGSEAQAAAGGEGGGGSGGALSPAGLLLLLGAARRRPIRAG